MLMLAWRAQLEIEGERGTGRTFTAYEARYSMPAVKAAEFASEQATIAAIAANIENAAGIRVSRD